MQLQLVLDASPSCMMSEILHKCLVILCFHFVEWDYIWERLIRHMPKWVSALWMMDVAKSCHKIWSIIDPLICVCSIPSQSSIRLHPCTVQLSSPMCPCSCAKNCCFRLRIPLRFTRLPFQNEASSTTVFEHEMHIHYCTYTSI